MNGHTFELLWWSGCPSHPAALELLASVLHDAGVDPAQIVTVQVVTMEDAEADHFVGSPTIRVDGRDIDPPEVVIPALTCRMYVNDGRPGPLPDRAKIESAVRQALHGTA